MKQMIQLLLPVVSCCRIGVGLCLGQDAFEPDNLPSNAKVIPSGSPQNRSIHVVGDVDWAQFTLGEASSVVIETSGDAGDTEMWLYGPNSPGKEVAHDDDSGSSPFFSRIERRGTDALLPGTYYIKISAVGSDSLIEAYGLTLTATRLSDPGAGADAFEPDDSPAQAKTISPGSTQVRSLNRLGDIDWVRFTVTTPSTVRIETDGESGDTEMWLFGPESSTRQVAYNDDSGARPFFSRIERTVASALAPGTYYVKVGEVGNNATISTYTLRLSVTPNNAGADAFEPDNVATAGKVISSGAVQNRSIYPLGDTDWVNFTLSVASYVRIETAAMAGNTELWLFGPDDSSIERAYDDDSGGGEFSLIDIATGAGLAPGSYWIAVADRGDDDVIPSYTLSFSARPSEATPSFAIASVSATAAEVALTWPSVVGKSYRIQSAPSLGAGMVWTDVSRSLKADSDRLTVSVERSSGAVQRYYRIVAE